MLISLRKAIDEDLEQCVKAAGTSCQEVLDAAGHAAAGAYPPTGEALKRCLSELCQHLENAVTPGALADAGKTAARELKTWQDSASRHYNESAREIRDLVLLVAKVASDVGGRDQRYSEQFQLLAERLEGAAKLDNLPAMRRSLNDSAKELVVCVTKMTEDGRTTVQELRAQVETYETRMRETEKLAILDPLTGVLNRRGLEQHLDRRISSGSPFCAVYLDLNGFKLVNDRLGHTAGDELLKQFATELRHCFRTSDSVGRWGGDEFLVLVDGSAEDASRRVEQVKKWVNGEYALPGSGAGQKVPVAAAVGLALWKKGTSREDLLRAADRAMYGDKPRPGQKRS